MTDIRIDYHPHARQRMRERRIADRQIEGALLAPDRRFPGHSGRTVVEKMTGGGNTLRVI